MPPLTAHQLIASFRSLVLAAWGDQATRQGVPRRDHPALAVVLGLLLDMHGYPHCLPGGALCIDDGDFHYAMSATTLFRVPRRVPPGPDPVDDGGMPDDGHGSRDPVPD